LFFAIGEADASKDVWDQFEALNSAPVLRLHQTRPDWHDFSGVGPLNPKFRSVAFGTRLFWDYDRLQMKISSR
jgi:hypothetical protein